MFQFGKLVDGVDVIKTVPAKSSSAKFLVNTESSVSVFPHLSNVPSFRFRLRTTDGSLMNTYGSCHLALQFSSRHFKWSFLLANLSMPILDSDFLCHNHLLVDVAGSCLFDFATLESIPLISSSSSNNSSDLFTAFLSTPEEFCDLLSKYPDVISSRGFLAADPKYPVRHTVSTLLTLSVLPKPAGLMQKSWNLQERSL